MSDLFSSPQAFAGMKLIVRFPQAVAGHMRINLGGTDGRMAKQFLDDPQVGAVLQ